MTRKNVAAQDFFINVLWLLLAIARVVELVDTLVLGTSDESREGSSPFSRTIKKFLNPVGLKTFLFVIKYSNVKFLFSGQT